MYVCFSFRSKKKPYRNILLAFETLYWDFDKVPVEKNEIGIYFKVLKKVTYICDKSDSEN